MIATFAVTNTGERDDVDVPQRYLVNAPDEKRMRLLGFERVVLKPGESKLVTITVDPRLLARFEEAARAMADHGREHVLALGKSAQNRVLTAGITLSGSRFGR